MHNIETPSMYGGSCCDGWVIGPLCARLPLILAARREGTVAVKTHPIFGATGS